MGVDNTNATFLSGLASSFTLQLTATQCNILQFPATHCNALQRILMMPDADDADPTRSSSSVFNL